MRIRQNHEYLYIPGKLLQLFEKEIDNTGVDPRLGVILHFRDTSYTAENGGFHPVEVAVDSAGVLQYITDFSYVGIGPMAELAKELDFDFSLGIFQQFGIEYELSLATEIFDLWCRNFIEYYSSGVYTISLESYT